ncbi:glycogen/starch synthase [Candidatus Woesearchaeota archaeon]|nr:glycogen/starch synthase [Candidatus Woesearchaeota archaeon]
MSSTYLFEISWEVCNKVGGIYTVIKSKSADVRDRYEKYFAIGPYFPDKHRSEFIEEPVPHEFNAAFNRLKEQGIVCHFGKWLTDTEISAILLDFSGFTARKDFVKAELWDMFKIDSLYTSYFDFDEPVIFSYAAGMAVEEFSKGKKAIAHCHEWLAGAALLYLKGRKANVASVFTTHATVLGRSFAGAGLDIYDAKFSADLGKPEYRTSMLPKHQIEEQAAKNADVFTTVSPITAIEAEKFLGRKVDVVLPNGLNTGKFPTFEEASIKHRLYKSKIKEFLLYYFFPYYDFDIDDTLIYFLASRYEFRAKGIDIFIRALGDLNRKLKARKSSKTIVAFFWVPGNVGEIRPELTENKSFFKDVKDSITDEHEVLMERLLTSMIASKSTCDESYLLGPSLLDEVRKKLLRFKRAGVPPLSTHTVHSEDSDQIFNAFKASGLLNRKADRVKVVFYPIYLTGSDGLLDLSYYEAMQGAHLGVFPSFYEPWGYTPVEAAALGVASVTTDLSGYGRYICDQSRDKESPGIFVVRRFGVGDDEVVKALAKILDDYGSLGVQERIKNKIDAKHLASLTDWKRMIKNYENAYNLALERA